MLIYLLLLLNLASPRQEQAAQTDKSVKLLAMPAGKSSDFPASRWYKAVLQNDSKDSIRLNAVQMPGGYSGDGRFYPCYLQLWDRKSERWVTHRLYEYYDARATPNIVQVEVSPGKSLEVCAGLYPQQLGHIGDCARFGLSPERGQLPLFFSNPFQIIGENKSETGCKGIGRTRQKPNSASK